MSPQPTPPERWWSPTENLIARSELGGYMADIESYCPIRLDVLPADAVRLVPETAADQFRAVEREAREVWLARVTAERDEARAELKRCKVLTNTLAQDSRRIATALHTERTMRKVVLAYLDDCDNGLGSVQGDRVRALLGTTDRAPGTPVIRIGQSTPTESSAEIEWSVWRLRHYADLHDAHHGRGIEPPYVGDIRAVLAFVGAIPAEVAAADELTAHDQTHGTPTTGHWIAPGVPCHGCQSCLVPDCPCAAGAFCSDHDQEPTDAS